jgi:hypothetical protein
VKQLHFELADEEKEALNGAKAYFASKKDAQLLNNVERMRAITESSRLDCAYNISTPDIDTPEKQKRKRHRRYKRKLIDMEKELLGSDSENSDNEISDANKEFSE